MKQLNIPFRLGMQYDNWEFDLEVIQDKIEYYDSYKETCIQLHEIKKDVFLAMENLNTTIGQTILNY